FRQTHPSILFTLKDHKITGYSDSLSAACVTLATTHLNHIVENFERRIVYFIQIKLKDVYKDMPKGFLYIMAREYCYEHLLGSNGNPKWPKQFDLVRIAHVNQITDIIQELKNRLLITPTTTNLTASPTKFLSVLGYIISELESICDNCTDPLDKPRNFSLVPTPSLRWKYISINCRSLATIVKKKSGTTYKENIEQFYSTFDFKKFGFENLEELLSPESKVRFMCSMMTDGFGACFVFARCKPKKETDP
ncbi:hypothetical protein INT46_008449, partial [Mucor plumbeus]